MIGLFAGTAHAQTEQRLPTDNELRASYCITYLQGSIKFQQQAALSSDPTTVAQANAALTISQTSLHKLQLYLLPRVPYLNAMALMGASASAQDDINRLLTMTPAQIDSLTKKTDSCRDPSSWLPI
jgi:hypothetical protein